MRASLANRLWRTACLPAAAHFRRACNDARAAQLRLLLDTLARNADTTYGRRYGFAGIHSAATYARRVPIVNYEDLREAVHSIRSGAQGILTGERVRLLQPSSGSSGPSKLIPYTNRLRSEFRHAVAVWVDGLFRSDPEIARGRAYWSITPVVDSGFAARGAVPVGFDDDASYLGGPVRSLVEHLLILPSDVRKVQDIEAFRYATLRFLLGAPDLRLISVWSPTFLSLLLKPMRSWWDALITDIRNGTLDPPGFVDPGVLSSLRASVRPDPDRAAWLSDVGPNPRLVWPDLRVISCWADGPSTVYAEQLRRTFEGTRLQPKGLIATEAFVTIPAAGIPGALPAITSHFLEFLPDNSDAEGIALVDELEPGARYEVIVTTGGGLYRYRLGDLVEVTGRRHGLPVLRFVGRADGRSDIFGEKLSEAFVADTLTHLSERFGLRPRFSMLAPERSRGNVRYIWLLSVDEPRSSGPDTASDIQSLSEALEVALCANFHYAACRRLGQLHAAEAVAVAPDAAERYLRIAASEGMRLGDIKIPSLSAQPGWQPRLV